MDLEQFHRFEDYIVEFDLSPSKKLLNSVWRDKIRLLWSLLAERAKKRKIWSISNRLWCRERDWNVPPMHIVAFNEYMDFARGFGPIQMHVPFVQIHTLLYKGGSMPPLMGPWDDVSYAKPPFIREGFKNPDDSDDGKEKGEEE